MATSEEERARILAEYAAMADDDDDDEADFDDDDDDSDDGSEEEDAEEDSNCAVLTGTVQLNDEMRLVYSGTWCMKEASSSDAKKNRKFKLKSKQVLCSSRDGSNSSNLFDFTNPTISKSKKKRPQASTDSVEVVNKRLILMDGFFVTDDGQGSSKKIKERDVEVFLSDDAGTKKGDKSCYTFVVTGKGTNEYGPFYFEGKYECATNSSDGDKEPTSASLICEKRYGVLAEKSASSPQRKRTRSNDFSDEDNDDEDDVEAFGDDDADLNEVIALNEEANMSVEELRRRYYNNSDDDKEAGADRRQSKKQKTKGGEESDDDDDECGF
jgi:hypothetical protein